MEQQQQQRGFPYIRAAAAYFLLRSFSVSVCVCLNRCPFVVRCVLHFEASSSSSGSRRTVAVLPRSSFRILSSVRSLLALCVSAVRPFVRSFLFCVHFLPPPPPPAGQISDPNPNPNAIHMRVHLKLCELRKNLLRSTGAPVIRPPSTHTLLSRCSTITLASRP